ncbi:hypothetical protein GJ496_004982 [Pomphorhynchus laevis]|nr:hypothetical protein GJ496_004982 [Pomphorhynchus laevis]
MSTVKSSDEQYHVCSIGCNSLCHEGIFVPEELKALLSFIVREIILCQPVDTVPFVCALLNDLIIQQSNSNIKSLMDLLSKVTKSSKRILNITTASLGEDTLIENGIERARQSDLIEQLRSIEERKHVEPIKCFDKGQTDHLLNQLKSLVDVVKCLEDNRLSVGPVDSDADYSNVHTVDCVLEK